MKEAPAPAALAEMGRGGMRDVSASAEHRVGSPQTVVSPPPCLLLLC